MVTCIEGRSADEVWTKAARQLMEGGCTVTSDSRLGITKEIRQCILSIGQPRCRWTVSRIPAINPAFAIAETVWILAGSREAGAINYWNAQLPKFAGTSEIYHGAYGFRLRSHFGRDQLEAAYSTLKGNPTSRQVVLQIWDPTIDLPNADGSPASPDIPCNIGALLKVREGKLDWTQIVRSNDIFRGLPYNLIQFTVLQEVMAGWLGLDVGTYTQLSDSLHLYETDFSTINICSDSGAFGETDSSLALEKEHFDRVLQLLVRTLERFSASDLSRREFEQLHNATDLPQGYLDHMLVVAAEAARKRGWDDQIGYIIGRCNSAQLLLAWERWLQRGDERRRSG